MKEALETIRVDDDLRFPVPTKKRWVPLRAGIHNIWEYDDQRFLFNEGRLLLHGRNESGKTKVIEVLVPFLLSGDLSPHRLDVFGTRSRPMFWNLLNENNPEMTQNSGYVWLEFGRMSGKNPVYCTIGAGLKATRASNYVRPWYFITGLRPDKDFSPIGRTRILLGKAKLGEALGEAGTVYDRGSDYKNEVNKTLFGLPEDQYDALLEALMQLRHPQLAKKLDKNALSRILSASLPPLNPSYMETLSESFKELERDRQERNELNDSYVLLAKFYRQYSLYVSRISGALAENVLVREGKRIASKEALDEKSRMLEGALEKQEEAAGEIKRIETERTRTDAQIEAITGSEEFRTVKEADEADKRARTEAERAGQAKDRLDRESADLINISSKLERSGKALDEAQTQVKELENTTSTCAQDADLHGDHVAIAKSLLSEDIKITKGLFGAVKDSRNEAITSVSELDVTVRKEDLAFEIEKGRHSDKERCLRDAKRELGRIGSELDEARLELAEEVLFWADKSEQIRVKEPEEELLEDVETGEARVIVEGYARARRAELHEEATQVAIELAAIQQDHDEAFHDEKEIEEKGIVLPASPPWKDEREVERQGAPFYMLTSFKDGIDVPAQAAIEAALEASGLLDGWVLPDGDVLNPDTCDVALKPCPREGNNLTAYIEPHEVRGITAEVINDLLKSVLVLEEKGTDNLDLFSVTTAGHFNIGPLEGFYTKDEPEFIGNEARERSVKNRLHELDLLLEDLEGKRTSELQKIGVIERKSKKLDQELAEFPKGIEVKRLERELELAARSHKEAHVEWQEAADSLDAARQARKMAVSDLRSEAHELGISRWWENIEGLRDASTRYFDAVESLISAQAIYTERKGFHDDLVDEHNKAKEKRGIAYQEHREAIRSMEAESARAKALRDGLGTSYQKIQDELGMLRETRDALKREAENIMFRKQELDRNVIELSVKEGGAKQELKGAEERLDEAIGDFQILERNRLTAYALRDEAPKKPAINRKQVLSLAKKVRKATEKAHIDQDAIDRSENNLGESHHELCRDICQEIGIRTVKQDGMLLITTSWRGADLSFPDLKKAVQADLVERESLLMRREEEIVESFLSGEANAHLRRLLKTSRGLVDKMNEELISRPTASGMIMWLEWSIAKGAPEGTREAIAIMRQSGALLTEERRKALATFIKGRLEDARLAESMGEPGDRIMAELDYRNWHEFSIKMKQGQKVSTLTTKTHGAGSGGQKAVMLHMPLFAAVAAFYDSARKNSLRLLVLDEVFAGIDKQMRASLMELLVHFDLDFIMTSHEEWGFYKVLDGLSTYELERISERKGVLATLYLWDGNEVTQMVGV